MPDLVHSGGAQPLQVCVHLCSWALESPLSLTGLIPYSEAMPEQSSSSSVLICLEREGGQSPFTFPLLEAKVEERQ